MNHFETNSKIKKNTIFFAVKIAALLFCAAPLFIGIFTGQYEPTLMSKNFLAFLAALLIILSILFIRYLIYKPQHTKLLDALEIVFFNILCVTSIWFSGGNTSYYKFIFIFIIIVYTMQIGMRAGLLLSFFAALFMFFTDWYGNSQSSDLAFFLYTDFCIMAMFFIMAFVIGCYVKMESEHIEFLKNLVNMDALTGIYNHRYFHEALERACAESKRRSKPLSIILLDIDFFHLYNNAYGYESGDKVIHLMASLLSGRLRKGDMIARFGGDKFGIILQDADQECAMAFSEQLRKYVEDYYFEGEQILPGKTLTVSLGVADLACTYEKPMQMIERAEAALYKAKFLRKNRVEIYSSIFDNFNDLNAQSKERMTVVKSLITIINSRDSYTFAHTERVLTYCQMFADYLELENVEKTKLIYSALLHDIGKVNVSKNALISEHQLTKEEWDEMKMHPADGAEIIRQLGNLDDVAEIVLQHHEKYDGSGYPSGLKGEEIQPLARMLTLADCFDAMTSKRPYQTVRTTEEALQELRRCKGSHFDPELTEKFIICVMAAKYTPHG